MSRNRVLLVVGLAVAFGTSAAPQDKPASAAAQAPTHLTAQQLQAYRTQLAQILAHKAEPSETASGGNALVLEGYRHVALAKREGKGVVQLCTDDASDALAFLSTAAPAREEK